MKGYKFYYIKLLKCLYPESFRSVSVVVDAVVVGAATVAVVTIAAAA